METPFAAAAPNSGSLYKAPTEGRVGGKEGEEERNPVFLQSEGRAQ